MNLTILNQTFSQIAINFIVVLGLSSSASAATVLYQAGNGTLPNNQGWTYVDPSGYAQQSVSSGLYSLSTESNSTISAGNFRFDQVFDTNVGFTLNLLDLQITAENHSNNNRAGFSLLFIGNDPTKSLELAFWEDRVWIYNYDTTNDFTQGIGVNLTTTQSRDYSLDVQAGNFKLLVDGSEQLNSSLVDYTGAFVVFPNPRSIYNTPNALFFGDDTTQANSEFSLSGITLEAKSTTEPSTMSGIFIAVGLAVFLNQKKKKYL